MVLPRPVLGIVPLSDKCLDSDVLTAFVDVGGGIEGLMLVGLGSLDQIPPLEGKLEENTLAEFPAPKLLDMLVPPLSYNLPPSRGDPVPLGSGIGCPGILRGALPVAASEDERVFKPGS